MNLTEMTVGLTDEIAQAVKQPSPVSFPIPKSRGWLEVGQFYSCIPDSAYPWDPVVMREILRYVPDAVPMWVQWVFETPLEDSRSEHMVFGRHALGRKIWLPRAQHEGFRVLMPTMPCQGLTFEKPNLLWFIHMGADNPKSSALPGSYLGFDDTLLDRVKQSAVGFQMSDKEYEKFLMDTYVMAPLEARARRREKFAVEMEYAQQELERYAAKVSERISDVEAAEYQRSVGKRKREPKPMVIVP